MPNHTISPRRSFSAVTLLLVAVLPAAAEAPRYVVRILESLPGGNTDVTSVNESGQTTGESGSNALEIGTHAFLGAPDGSIVNIEDESLNVDISHGAIINERGQVAGTVTVFPGQQGVSEIFRYTPGGGMAILGSLGGDWGEVLDMNDHGVIVGYWDNGITTAAFVYRDGEGLVDLGALVGGRSSRARDVNDLGNIVGDRYVDNVQKGFVILDGELVELGTLGGNGSTAYYIDNNNVVVGSAQTTTGEWHAYRWTGSDGMQDIQSLPGAKASAAFWNTISGIIVGSWIDQLGRGRAFFYHEDLGMIDLGIQLQTAWDGVRRANERGDVILNTVNQFYEPTPFYYTPATGLLPLNDLLLGPPLGFPLQFAEDLNERGQIVATGRNSRLNRDQSVLLTPLRLGDLNCDGTLDFGDINPFVQALTAPNAWQGTYPNCVLENADLNQDGQVDFGDINPFVALLGTPG